VEESAASVERQCFRNRQQRPNPTARLAVSYEADAAYIYLTDEALPPGRDSIRCGTPDGVNATVVLDWKDGRITGVEVLEASHLLHPDLLASVRPRT
jgi:uncharacterized protein YuzE